MDTLMSLITLDRLTTVTPQTANASRLALKCLSDWHGNDPASLRLNNWGSEDGHSRFTSNLTADWVTLADLIWDAAVVMNAVYDAHSVALNRDEYIPLVATITPITGEIDLQNRNAQARALLAMRNREAAAQKRVEEVLEELRIARERAEANQREAVRLRDEQITRGDDDRLVEFWAIAEKNANDAGFCSEYDRMADMMGGTGRERDWNIQGSITVTIPFSMNVSATSEDNARDEINDYGMSDWIDTIREASSWNGELDDVTINDISAD